MIAIRMASRSEQGARSGNEDVVRHGVTRNGHYAVLADGAGGHQRGAEAAQHAADCVEQFLRDDTLAFSPASLTRIVRLAHAALQRSQTSEQPGARMHCTIVVLWIAPEADRVLWTHVGDSRLYRIRQGHADFVTSDDSVVQRMLQAGLITAEQSRQHPQKNQLLSALGVPEEVEPHTVVRPVELLEGDAFLLCSDGWWEAFETAALVDSLSRSLTPQDWVDDMQRQVDARGKARQDNYSAIAVWAGHPGEVTRPVSDETLPPMKPRRGP